MPGDRLSAGRRDRRLTPLKRSVTTDAAGEPVESFTALTTVWASKTDLKTQEGQQGAQTAATIETEFEAPWSPQIAALDAKDRCRVDGRDYEITGIEEIGRRVGRRITATARADQTQLYST